MQLWDLPSKAERGGLREAGQTTANKERGGYCADKEQLRYDNKIVLPDYCYTRNRRNYLPH